MVRVYGEETKKQMQKERDDRDKINPCTHCGMVKRASDCGIHERWKRGVFGLKGSGCMPLDFHRAYLYRKTQSDKNKKKTRRKK